MHFPVPEHQNQTNKYVYASVNFMEFIYNVWYLVYLVQVNRVMTWLTHWTFDSYAKSAYFGSYTGNFLHHVNKVLLLELTTNIYSISASISFSVNRKWYPYRRWMNRIITAGRTFYSVCYWLTETVRSDRNPQFCNIPRQHFYGTNKSERPTDRGHCKEACSWSQWEPCLLTKDSCNVTVRNSDSTPPLV